MGGGSPNGAVKVRHRFRISQERLPVAPAHQCQSPAVSGSGALALIVGWNEIRVASDMILPGALGLFFDRTSPAWPGMQWSCS